MSDDLYDGPTLLAPGAPERSDHLARKLLIPLVLFLCAVLAVFYVLFSTASVDGDSMLPALRSVDHLLVTKGYEDPVRGDVVIIDVSRISDQEGHIVKRVAALPGDRVAMAEDILWVNGAMEETSTIWTIPGYGESFSEQIMPSGHLYVLGDNRPSSMDSRYVGAIPLQFVEGKAFYIFAPINRFGPVQ